MLRREEIKNLFYTLNKKLKAKGQKGEIGIVGGAVMCLVFQSREATKNIDALFEPASEIRELVIEIA